MAFRLASAFVDIFVKRNRLNEGLRSVSNTISGAFSRTNSLLALGGTALSLAALSGAARKAVALAGVQEQAEARIAAVIRSTGKAAGFSAEQLKAFASERQKLTTTGDEELLDAMSLLLTFKSVTGDVFKRATIAAQDLAAAGFGVVSGNVVQLGKALEDPKKGMSALSKSGVSFSEKQKKVIENLVNSNKLFEAQVLILEAIEGQVKDAAAALALTPTGKIKQLNNLLGDTSEELGNKLLPSLVKFKQIQLGIAERWVDELKVMLDATDIASRTIELQFEGLVLKSQIALSELFAGELTEFFANRNPIVRAIQDFGGLDQKVLDEAMRRSKEAAKQFTRQFTEPEKAAERLNEIIAELSLQMGSLDFPGTSDFKGLIDTEVTAELKDIKGFFDITKLAESVQMSLLDAKDEKAEEKQMVGLMEAGNAIMNQQKMLLEKVNQNTSKEPVELEVAGA